MIGDWVYDPYSKKNKKVTGTTLKHIRLSNRDFSTRIYEPIPITPEILKKNGFKKELEFWNDNFGFPFFIREEKDEYDLIILSWEGEDTAVLSIKYVHELQHALRLCGIEKEIEL